jgi:hypothetical protein
MGKLLSTKKTKINFCEAVADIFHCASLEAQPLGHHPQIIAQLFIALFDVVSNFAALKFCDERSATRRRATFCHSFNSSTLRLKISGSVGMTSGIRPRALFVCPKCGIGYRAICEQHPSEQSGRLDCIDCRFEVHSCSGIYDYTDWKAVIMKPMSPGEKI